MQEKSDTEPTPIRPDMDVVRKGNAVSRCLFCGAPASENNFCYGCKSYICDDCMDVDNDPWGDHEPGHHPAAAGD